jgi:protein gp37
MNPQGKGKIEWTDLTWSPVTGCQHGCSYCYANGIAQRIYSEKFKPTFRPQRLHEPATVKKPSKVFVCDMGDLFGDWVPNEWIAKVMQACDMAPQHTYQFLTKNPKRYLEFEEIFPMKSWLGTTIESEEFYKERSEPMWKLTAPDIRRFVSFEPLLGEVPLDSAFDWVIVGEQTGRTYNVDEKRDLLGWAQHILHDAQDLKIPIFFKNWLGTMFPQREFPR